MSPTAAFRGSSLRQRLQRTLWAGSVAAIGLSLTVGPLSGQEASGPQRKVDPVSLPLDKPGVYTLNFAYTPVRIMTVDTPDRGKRTVWYMVYQVWNRTDTPQPFTPELYLVTKDGSAVSARYLDEPEPGILKKIQQVEDPTGALDLQSSISISKKKIPVTKPNSVARAVHGVAIWPDVAEKSARVNRFSVYVNGLSNGNSAADTEDGGVIVRQKTLQIDFVRPTDDRKHEINDIRPHDNGGLGSEKWIYSETTKRPPAAAEPKKE